MMSPNTPEAYKLFSAGSLCLARMEERGMRIDIQYLKQKSDEMAMELAIMHKDILANTDEGQCMVRAYGKQANLNSPQQIAHVFFKVKKYKLPDDKKNTDDAALIRINTPFCKQLSKYRSLDKAKGTYLDNIIRQVVKHKDGLWYLHPTFGLMLVSTFRSSSYDPNLQNIPIRDPYVGKLVRSAFYPREGFQLMEIDYSGAEVANGCCYHKDSNMIKYLLDPTTNMHTDTCADSFLTTKELITKPMRQATKTFVFGEFYGDWYKPQARTLWESMIREEFKLEDGEPVKRHLKFKGIRNLDDFTDHMKEVERILWEERFGEYAQWKEDTWDFYCRNGYYHTLTGFTIHGLLNKKQVCNSPIQGSASHWLLWSATKLDNWMVKNRLQSRLVGQIHDSMIGDIHPSERDYVAEKAIQIMTKDIYKHWDWINVPLKAEIDMAPVNGSWYEKKPYEVAA